MSLFAQWKSVVQNGQYLLQKANHLVLFYSNRSLGREAKALQSKLEQAKSQKAILIWVAPFHRSILEGISTNSLTHLLWIAIATFPIEADNSLKPHTFLEAHYPYLVWNETGLQHRLREIQANNQFFVQFHPSFSEDSSYTSKTHEYITYLLTETARRLKTIQYLSRYWEYNFRANQQEWQITQSIQQIQSLPKPEVFVLGSPKADLFLDEIEKQPNHPVLWCADTALAGCFLRNINPELVFSIDPGFGSYEHISYILHTLNPHRIRIILDPFSQPMYYRMPFQKYTYANSNPLLKDVEHSFPYIVNDTQDVYGIMVATFHYLYPNSSLPLVVGRDMKAFQHVTHLRNSGYHFRMWTTANRVNSELNYFYQLGKRFG